MHCVKYDRHGYKARRRILIVTENGCFLLDASNFKLKEQFSFQEIQQITVSSLTDGLVVIRLPIGGANHKVRSFPPSQLPYR